MYTRCPECSTIFRVTAAQLRTALGEVSCGSCQTTFNAVAALTDELPELTDAVTLDPASTGAPEADVVDDSSDEEREDEPEEGRDDREPDSDDADESLPEDASHFTDEHEDENQGDDQGDDENADADEEEIDDNLIDTFVDETHETELSADEADDNLIDTMVDEDSETYPNEDDDPDAQDETPAEQDNENAGSAWARILADDDGRSDDRRELETEARVGTLREQERAEPAYDDHRGYEEILDEDDFLI